MGNFLKTLALSILLVFAPVKATLITVGVLVVLDLILGLFAANKRGDKITSSGLKRTVIKFLVYEIAVLAGYLVQQYCTGSEIPVVSVISSFIGMTELKSVFENLNEIQGGNLLKALIDKLSAKNETQQ